MKKGVILLSGILILGMILIFIMGKEKPSSNLPSTSNIIETLEEPSIQIPKNKEKLRLAYEGRMDKSHLILGENSKQYIIEPRDMYYFLGGLVIEHEGDTLFTNGYLDDDNKPVYGDIVIIVKEEGYGIKSGMSMEKVKETLGEPDEIIDFNTALDPSEIYQDNIIFSYEVGKYGLVIEFDKTDKTVRWIYLNNFDNNSGYPTSEVIDIDFLKLLPKELDAYNKFKVKYDEEELRGLDILSIMKLHLHAKMEGDYETEWELYTKEENQKTWDKEEHLNLMKEQGGKKDFSEFKNPVNIKIDRDRGFVSWEDKFLEEYDGNGYPFRYSFNLGKNKEGIWKVAFTPMQ